MSAHKAIAGLVLAAALAGCGDQAPFPLRAVALSTGPEHACAVSDNGVAYCWGNGMFGEFSRQPAYAFAPLAIEKIPVALVSVTAGYNHSCGLGSDRQAYCWGWGIYGQTGAGGPNAGDPTVVVGGHSFTALSAGWYHTCALDVGGAAWCWGRNSRGQLGDGTDTTRYAPVAVAGGLTFATISAGAAHTCAVTASGAAYCWGSNETGQLGDGTTRDALSPTRVAGPYSFAAVSAGYNHSCGVIVGGGAACWGANESGQLGNSTVDRVGLPGVTTPQPLFRPLAFTGIEAGYLHTCGTVQTQGFCWGAGEWGQLGTGFMQLEAVSKEVAGVSGPSGPDQIAFAAISPGGLTYSCGLSTSGTPYCWGRGIHGELGRPDVTTSALPVTVSSGERRGWVDNGSIR